MHQEIIRKQANLPHLDVCALSPLLLLLPRNVIIRYTYLIFFS